MLERIATELKRHIPFTASGTLFGIIILVIVFAHTPQEASETIFYIFHPLHVLLSALVTTAMYQRYRKGNIWAAALIGWTGSVGIATISDSLIPYAGEALIRLPSPEPHIGFVEKWWLVNSLALAGIALGYWRPATRVPHAGHVLLSTWASLFHIVMALGEALNWLLLPAIALFLFLAVWLPCCTSDIIYPLLFVREVRQLPLPKGVEAIKLEERAR